MYEYKALVTNVVDGDTVDCLIDLGFDITYKARVRLYNIDTPESRTRNLVEKKEGLRAKKFTQTRVLGQKVVIKTHLDKKGKYGRLLADIFYKDSLGVEHSIVEQLKEFGFEKKDHY